MKKPSGFTIVELLVVIAIFTLVTTAVFTNLRSAGPRQEIKLQASNLASLLRQAQVQSLSGTPFEGAVPIGGYGVAIAVCSTPPCKVQLFADVDGDFDFDPTELVQEVSFGTNVTIDALSIGSSTNVIFKPPRPLICFNDVCSGINEVIVTIGGVRSNTKAEVVINQVSGQVSL